MLVVAACLFAGLPAPALAAINSTTICINGETFTATVSRDDAGARTVEVVGDNESSIVTFSKSNSVISGTAKTNGKNHKFTAKPPKGVSVAAVVPLGGNGDLWWKHKYSRYKSGSTITWHTEKSSSSYKNTQETSTNSNDLHGFSDAIDSCKVNQTIAVTSLGAGAAAFVAGAMSAAGTVTLSLIIGILLAIGAGISAAGYLLAAWTYKCHADFHYGGY